MSPDAIERRVPTGGPWRSAGASPILDGVLEPLHLLNRRPRAPRCAGCGRSLAGERLPVRDLDGDGRLRVFHQVCALRRPA